MERYQFLKWGASAFDNFKVVPPGTGICHQVNLENIARTVWSSPEVVPAGDRRDRPVRRDEADFVAFDRPGPQDGQRFEVPIPAPPAGTHSPPTLVNPPRMHAW